MSVNIRRMSPKLHSHLKGTFLSSFFNLANQQRARCLRNCFHVNFLLQGVLHHVQSSHCLFRNNMNYHYNFRKPSNFHLLYLCLFKYFVCLHIVIERSLCLSVIYLLALLLDYPLMLRSGLSKVTELFCLI